MPTTEQPSVTSGLTATSLLGGWDTGTRRLRPSGGNRAPLGKDRAVTTERDRDTEGRARNARPRDALGRPLPYGAAGEERAPEGIVRPPDRALAEAQQLLDAGRPFHAHEVLEDAWKSAPDAERQLWRGLAQLAVGLTHAARGNARGAATLLDRGAGNLDGYAVRPPHGIDVAGLSRWARALAADAGAGRDLDVRPPRLASDGTPPAAGADSLG
jgi:hypothetical protein